MHKDTFGQCKGESNVCPMYEFPVPGLLAYLGEYSLQTEAEDLVLKGNVGTEKQAGLGQCPEDTVQC